MLDFQTRAQRGERTYREAVAEAQGELDTSAMACAACARRAPRRLDRPRGVTITTAPEGPPPDMPRRDGPARRARAGALEPTAIRLARLARSVLKDTTFDIWLAPLALTDATTAAVFLAAPTHLASWAAERYAPLLAHIATSLAGRSMLAHIYVAVGDDLAGARTLGELLTAEEEGPR